MPYIKDQFFKISISQALTCIGVMHIACEEIPGAQDAKFYDLEGPKVCIFVMF